MERTGTSRSCLSGPARQVAGRHVVGQPDAVGGLVEGVAGRVHGHGVHRQDDGLRRRLAAEMSGLDIHYDLGEGHPLLGRRMPDLDLVTANGPLRVCTLLYDARPVLLNLSAPGGVDITPCSMGGSGPGGRRNLCWDVGASGPWRGHCSRCGVDSARRLCGLGGRPHPPGAP